MTRFGAAHPLPVRAPFRLDLTVDALRRLASNAVDVVGPDGTYYRALRDADGPSCSRSGSATRALSRFAPRGAAPSAGTRSSRVCSARASISPNGMRAARAFAWLAPLAAALRGLKPPRYPTLWEAFAHAIVFQQISIHAAAAIMRRSVDLLGESVTRRRRALRRLSARRSAGWKRARPICGRRASRATRSRICAAAAGRSPKARSTKPRSKPCRRRRPARRLCADSRHRRRGAQR